MAIWQNCLPNYIPPDSAGFRQESQGEGKDLLDALEGLIVSRMFELTKMNMSQTGTFYLATLYLLALNPSLQAISYENTLQRPLVHGRRPSAPPSIATMMPPPP